MTPALQPWSPAEVAAWEATGAMCDECGVRPAIRHNTCPSCARALSEQRHVLAASAAREAAG